MNKGIGGRGSGAPLFTKLGSVLFDENLIEELDGFISQKELGC